MVQRLKIVITSMNNISFARMRNKGKIMLSYKSEKNNYNKINNMVSLPMRKAKMKLQRKSKAPFQIICSCTRNLSLLELSLRSLRN